MDQDGRSMADQQTFGSVVATILVIVVTVQVSIRGVLFSLGKNRENYSR